MKLKLIRRKSGRKIRQEKRQAELHPSITHIMPDGQVFVQKKYIHYENKGLYNSNKPQKRHIENPNIYEGEPILRCGIRNIRVPRKARKTAWKRFAKAFPYVKINKQGRKVFLPDKLP